MYEVEHETRGIKREDGAVVCEDHIYEALEQGFTIHGHRGVHIPLRECPGGECFICEI